MTIRKNVVVQQRDHTHIDLWQYSDQDVPESYISWFPLNDFLIKLSLTIEKWESNQSTISPGNYVRVLKEKRDMLQEIIDGPHKLPPPDKSEFVKEADKITQLITVEYRQKSDIYLARKFETNNDDGSHIRSLVSWANSQQREVVVSHDDTCIYIHDGGSRSSGPRRVNVGEWLVKSPRPNTAWISVEDASFRGRFEQNIRVVTQATNTEGITKTYVDRDHRRAT